MLLLRKKLVYITFFIEDTAKINLNQTVILYLKLGKRTLRGKKWSVIFIGAPLVLLLKNYLLLLLLIINQKYRKSQQNFLLS